MKVKMQNSWAPGHREMDLEKALQPPHHNDDGGAVERVRAQAEANAEAIGRLLAHLVEYDSLTLEKACEIAGVYAEVTPL